MGIVLLILLVLATVVGLSIGLGTYYGLKNSEESLVDAITTADLKELLLVCIAIVQYLIVFDVSFFFRTCKTLQ